MSFFSNLFKKKPGGTLVGNLLRGVAQSVPIVGGTVIGTGKDKIELGQTQTNGELASQYNQLAQQQAVSYTHDADGNIVGSIAPVTVSASSGTSPGVTQPQQIDLNDYIKAPDVTVKPDRTIWFALGGIALILLLGNRRR